MIKKIKFLQKIHMETKQSALGASADLVPDQYQSHFINLGGAFEAHYIIFRLLERVKKQGKVLIIGVSGGRDYYGLLIKGYEVYGFDITRINDISNLIIGNVEESLPFQNGYFDAVVLGEVIEHLKYDVNALENIRKILKDDGVLIVTVPFYHDEPEYHLRIHSRKSCARLLNSCGYEILCIVERPALFRIPVWVNWLNHLIGWVYLKLTGRSLHRVLLTFWAEIEFNLGQKNLPLRKLSKMFGGYYLVKKTDDILYDHISLNKNSFSGISSG